MTSCLLIIVLVFSMCVLCAGVCLYASVKQACLGVNVSVTFAGCSLCFPKTNLGLIYFGINPGLFKAMCVLKPQVSSTPCCSSPENSNLAGSFSSVAQYALAFTKACYGTR